MCVCSVCARHCACFALFARGHTFAETCRVCARCSSCVSMLLSSLPARPVWEAAKGKQFMGALCHLPAPKISLLVRP